MNFIYDYFLVSYGLGELLPTQNKTKSFTNINQICVHAIAVKVIYTGLAGYCFQYANFFSRFQKTLIFVPVYR